MIHKWVVKTDTLELTAYNCEIFEEKIRILNRRWEKSDLSQSNFDFQLVCEYQVEGI